MPQHKKSWLVILGLLTLVCTLTTIWTWAQSKSEAQEEINDTTIIVVANGSPIPYKDIKASANTVSILLEMGGASSVTSIQQQEKVRQQIELKGLEQRINKVITADLLKRFDIKISDKEIYEKQKEVEEKVDFVNAANVIREQAGRLLRALNLVYEEGQDPEKIYNDLLSKELSKVDWKVNLDYYKSADRREGLRKMAQIEAEQLERKTLSSIRLALEDTEIAKSVNRLLNKRDAKFAEYQELLTKDKKNSDLSKIKEYLEQRQREWWAEYLSGIIEIRVKKFENVLQHLINDRVGYGY